MIEKIKGDFKNFKPYINGWQDMKRASVAILLVEIDRKLNILFEVRSKYISQPKDIAFAGGRIDKGETPKEAVVREVKEELGLNDHDFEIISPLNILVTHYGTLIHPFLGYIKNFDNIKINESEVDHIFLVPLDYLLNTKPRVEINKTIIERSKTFPFDLINGGENYKFKSGELKSIFYTYEDYVIWGMTGSMLYDFLENLYKFL